MPLSAFIEIRPLLLEQLVESMVEVKVTFEDAKTFVVDAKVQLLASRTEMV